MCEDCVPYRKKSLYLGLTVPMLVMYVAIAVLLWRASIFFFVLYAVLFVVVAVGQAYVCNYWNCPYVGRFGPCVGGFCLPSSQIARLFKRVRRSEAAYNVAMSAAFVALLGIILLPLYFLYVQGVWYLVAYLGIVLAYATAFLWWICSACATRQVCPGGQASTGLRRRLAGK
ncbi:MAG: hypothetical protein P8129_01010 [Anaerolineae bacterium]